MMVQATTRRANQETDTRLKVEQRLKKIGSSDPETLLEEIEAFEKQLTRSGIDRWRQWYRYFSLVVKDYPKVLRASSSATWALG